MKLMPFRQLRCIEPETVKFSLVTCKSKFHLNKIAVQWPAKAVVQFFFFNQKAVETKSYK